MPYLRREMTGYNEVINKSVELPPFPRRLRQFAWVLVEADTVLQELQGARAHVRGQDAVVRVLGKNGPDS